MAAGPPFVSAQAGYSDLLAAAGFEEIEEIDVTGEYRETAAAWLRECTGAARDLTAIFGEENFLQGQRERRESLAAIEDGLLRRSLFTARAG